MFTVDQDRSWAILDDTGKKILQIPAASTNRHEWLEEMSHSTSTPSISASPVNSLVQLHGESQPISNMDSGLVINTAIPDVMMASLNGQTSFSESDRGQTIGPPEAFYANGLHYVGGDYAVSPEPESDAYEEVTPVEKKARLPLEEFLEDLGESDSDEQDSALPLYAPADENLTGDNDALFGHLNKLNVTAFRRSADPMSTSRPGTSYSYDFHMSPDASSSSFAIPAAPLRTPTPSHKRKVSSTPYQDEKIYGDVTPVERKVIHVSKRRKMTT
jgi:hypothetical protein